MPPQKQSIEELSKVLEKIDHLPGVSTGDRVLLQIAAVLAHTLPPIVEDLLTTIPPTLPDIRPEFREHEHS
jgi:hypothetical protein